jgi:cullin-5
MLDAYTKISFEKQWPSIKPIIMRLLKQEPIQKKEWTNLFTDIHNICLWDEKSIPKMKLELESDILDFIKIVQENILHHENDESLLRAYIQSWTKFFDQTMYLPKPFFIMEAINGNGMSSGSGYKDNVSSSGSNPRDECESHVKKLMLDTWNKSIFSDIKYRLKNSAMRIVYAERVGEPFDSQLAIGVRESYVNLCSNSDDKLKIYHENFEKAYLDSTSEFYAQHAQTFIAEHGIIKYLEYADSKLKEEEKRGLKYLETCKGSESMNLVNIGREIRRKMNPFMKQCHFIAAQNLREYTDRQVSGSNDCRVYELNSIE